MATLLEIPTGPIFREKSGTQETASTYEKQLLRWRDSALEAGVAELKDSPEYDHIDEYIRLIAGEHWYNLNMPTYRNKFVDNRIGRARVDSLAYLTDIHPTIDVRTHVHEYQKAAEIIKGIIQYEWNARHMDRSLDEVLDHSLLGTGFWKIGAVYPGEFNIISCGMDTVVPIQQGRDLQDSVAVLYRAYKPPHYFKSRWGTRADGIEREAEYGMMATSNDYSKPWGINDYTWNSMSPAMRYHKSRTSPKSSNQDNIGDFPMIQLQEFWIEDWHTNDSEDVYIVKDPYRALTDHNYWYRVNPGERLYPRKRLLVFAGDRVMYDGPSPYWGGDFPFAKLCLNPVVWSSGGMSKYRDLVPLNQALNRVMSGIDNVVDKAIKPITVTRDGAVNSTSWEKFFSDKPGGKLKLTPMGNPQTDVRFIDPPVLPSYVQQYVQQLISSFREQEGSLDMSSLQKKKQLPGGDSIQAYQDSMSAARRREVRALEVFLEEAGKIAYKMVPQFWSRDQRMKVLGIDGMTPQDFDFKPGTMNSWAGEPEEFIQNFSVEIVPGSLHPGAKDRAASVAMQLRRTHDISLKELFRRLDIGNAEDIIRELQEEAKMGLMPPPKGAGKKNIMPTRGQKNGQPV